MNQNSSLINSIEKMYDRAATLVDIQDGLRERIKQVNPTYTVRFGVCLRNKAFSFTGWRPAHKEHCQPTRGGIQYSPDSGVFEVEALAPLVSLAYTRMVTAWSQRSDAPVFHYIAVGKEANTYQAIGI